MQEDKQITNETIRPKSWPNKMEVSLVTFKIYIPDIHRVSFHETILITIKLLRSVRTITGKIQVFGTKKQISSERECTYDASR